MRGGGESCSRRRRARRSWGRRRHGDGDFGPCGGPRIFYTRPATLLATNSESAIRGLDFVIALTLCTSREPKRALRSINDDAASALVWVVDKLVKTYS